MHLSNVIVATGRVLNAKLSKAREVQLALARLSFLREPLFQHRGEAFRLPELDMFCERIVLSMVEAWMPADHPHHNGSQSLLVPRTLTPYSSSPSMPLAWDMEELVQQGGKGNQNL